MDVDDNGIDQDLVEDKFNAQLQQLIIAPYAERLQNLLTDLFT